MVELSIVLVILGLLTGGILAGQSLIRAAELRAVTTEYNRYVAATQTFRDKYMAIPGDFRDATRFWLRQGTTACTTNSAAAVGSPGTCDGNGNGNIEPVAAASTSSEIFQYWRQLALASLIEGSYTGLSGTSNATGYHAIFGENVPPSKLSNAGWSINYLTATGIDNAYFANQQGNTFYFGAATTGNLTSGNVLKPEEAWNIDTKLDDGKPGRGRVTARSINTCTDAGSAAGNSNNLDANYLLDSSSTACALHFPKLF